MTEFKIIKSDTKDFILDVSGIKKIFVTEDETAAEIAISYADIVRIKLACEEARKGFQ
jgi:anti-sigma regulatory factor (Ser/Thr protein kinase)